MDRLTRDMLRTVAKILVPIINDGDMSELQKKRVYRAYRSILLAIKDN